MTMAMVLSYHDCRMCIAINLSTAIEDRFWICVINFALILSPLLSTRNAYYMPASDATYLSV
jgi:hypothetical protein